MLFACPKDGSVHAPIIGGFPMLKIAITVLAAICLYPFSAKSQDALGTFMFLVLSPAPDITRDYGKEFKIEDGKTKHTIRKVAECVFAWEKAGVEIQRTNPNVRIHHIRRWDFTKAYISETKIERYLDGHIEITIPGENGVILTDDSCVGDDGSCNIGSPNNFPSSIGFGRDESDAILIWAAKDNADRNVKAWNYFTQKFCPGVKRKSAF
jgi:hypothetical protein